MSSQNKQVEAAVRLRPMEQAVIDSNAQLTVGSVWKASWYWCLLCGLGGWVGG